MYFLRLFIVVLQQVHLLLQCLLLLRWRSENARDGFVKDRLDK